MPKSIERLKATTERWVTLNLCMIFPINFAIEPLIPAMVGGRASLGDGKSVYLVDILYA